MAKVGEGLDVKVGGWSSSQGYRPGIYTRDAKDATVKGNQSGG